MTFLQISADFVIQFEKFLFQLKALQKLILKDVTKYIFCSSSGSGDIREKRKAEIQRGCVFLLLTVAKAM